MRRSLSILIWASIALGLAGPMRAGSEGWRGLEVRTAQAQAPEKPGGRGGAGVRGGVNKSLLERSLAALDAKDFSLADRLLREGYRLSPRPEFLYHLGRVALGEKRLLEAYDLFRRYSADPAREPNEETARFAEQQLSQPPPPSGSIVVVSDPGTLVLVDERPVGTLPLPVPLLLSPGAHTVALEFPGKRLDAPIQVQLDRTTEVRFSRASGAVVLFALPAILLAAAPSGLPVDTARLLSDAIDQAARGEQHTILRGERVLPPLPASRDCLARETCQRELAQKHAAKFVLQQAVELTGPPKSVKWKLTLRLLRVDIVDPAGATTLTVEPGPAEQISARLREAATQLLATGLVRPRGTVRITTDPPAATLRLDAHPPRPSPYSAPLWAGQYQLHISHPGYQTEQRTVTIENGRTLELPVELQRGESGREPGLDARPQSRASRPKWRLALGGALIGAGVILGAVGVAGLAVDGQCAAPPDIDGGTCAQLRNTTPTGGFAFGSGLFMAGAGILTIALPGPTRTAP